MAGRYGRQLVRFFFASEWLRVSRAEPHAEIRYSAWVDAESEAALGIPCRQHWKEMKCGYRNRHSALFGIPLSTDAACGAWNSPARIVHAAWRHGPRRSSIMLGGGVFGEWAAASNGIYLVFHSRSVSSRV